MNGSFEILKEWEGKNGVKARLSRCMVQSCWCYALDYRNCMDTVDIEVKRTPIGVTVIFPLDMPSSYKREVKELIKKAELMS